jgi:serine/threonine protein kinase
VWLAMVCGELVLVRRCTPVSVSANLDVRADIYAVGATLYYLLTGCPPLDAPDLRQGAVLERREPARRPDLQLGKRELNVSFDVFNLLNADSDQQFFDGGNQPCSSNYAIEDGEFFGLNTQPPRQGQVTMRFTF